MERKPLIVFDTTLRDGEQSPGCSMNLKEKLEVASQLEKLRVDVIEAGFAIASPGDFEAVKAVAKTVRNACVASLSRATTQDIDRAYEAVKVGEAPRIHTFIATSDIHIEYKLKSTREEVLERAVAMVKYAKNYLSDVQFSAEDATRTDTAYLYRILEAVIKAGATTVNIPDTVGYTTPDEFYSLIQGIRQNVPNIHHAVIAVHCHNDLGMAVANSLAAVKAGATQVECTINGIGERAGNAAMEEIVMALHTRADQFQGVYSNILTTQLYPASRMLTQVTGMRVQRNKAIVGENAFAHEAGIHQHGVLANKSTYEIMTPESVGVPTNQLVLGKHSGRHAFEDRLKDLGYTLEKEMLDKVFQDFKELADKKKVVYDRDLEALVQNKTMKMEEHYKLKQFVINCGNQMTATATVKLENGKEMEEVSTGTGPIYASFGAIDKLVGMDFSLEDYSLQALTEGEDALGEAFVQIRLNDRKYHGSGVSTDVIEASIKAYLNAINRMVSDTENKGV